MTKLYEQRRWRELVDIEPRYERSVNLERDYRSNGSLNGYVVTPLVRNTLSRVVDGLTGRGARAWSFTGPYGSGKSAFAVFAANLLRGSDGRRTSVARGLLAKEDPALHRRIFHSRSVPLLCPVLATGDRKSLEAVLLGAAAATAAQVWRRNSPRLVTTLNRLAARAEQGERIPSRDVVRTLEELADAVAALREHGEGLLILIDEAGKALEFAAHHPERADIHLLQELAESATRSGDRPIILGVLLHQSFDQYAGRLSVSQRNEWGKVQGRFEDVPFQEDSDQVLRLVGLALRRLPLPPAVRAGCNEIVKAVASEASPRAVTNKRNLEELLGATLPLHPVTALILGPMFRLLAQNERSLFAFLTSAEPLGFQGFLETPVFVDEKPSLFSPDRLYDYLMSAFGERLYSLAGRHWAQTEAALRRLPPDADAIESSLVKTVGLLSPLAEATGVPVSERILELCVADGSASSRARVRDALVRLQASSVLVFRKFRNSFQLWDGSDLDIESRVRAAYAQVDPRAQLLRTLNRIVPARPVVARRHLFRTGNFRYFEVQYGDESVVGREWAPEDSSADGVIFLVVPSSDAAAREVKTRLNDPQAWSAITDDAKPVIIGILNEAARVREIGLDLAALEWTQSHTVELEGDPVARRELAGRIADAENLIQQEITALLNGSRESAWYCREGLLLISTGRQLAEAVSAVCDRAYSQAPFVFNELLNRNQLSSAAAAARRELIQRMLTASSLPRLGIEGHPPELSMYRTLLEQHGAHRERKSQWQLCEPRAKDEGGLSAAFDTIIATLGGEGVRVPLVQVYAALRKPPFGMKDGVIPVLAVLAVTLAHREIAIYEEGAFVPELTPAVVERLLRAPDQFELQRFRVAGARAGLFGELAGSVDDGPLPLIRQFVREIQELTDFARNTGEVSQLAVRVREAILRAEEPGTLLFRDLPRACDLQPITTKRTSAVPSELVARLTGALKELRGAYPELLRNIQGSIFKALQVPDDDGRGRVELAERARRLLQVATDTKLKGLLIRLSDDALDPAAWAVSVGTLVVSKPPEAWTDLDLPRFSINLTVLARRFAALEAAFVAQDTQALPAGTTVVRFSVTEVGGDDVERVVFVREGERRMVEALSREVRLNVDSMRGDVSGEAVIAALAKVAKDLIVEFHGNNRDDTEVVR
ncbi:hypothetical protein [Anaeromyxobacter sp. SG17]|uniref:hypothetical protein n=1 Tax=Anaeromyxobacter sp. SG17 TaxID=2925405 RepID=UPI001F592920|nr:hypothetical protein [Anaeromyxobacter sp. SG17]